MGSIFSSKCSDCKIVLPKDYKEEFCVNCLKKERNKRMKKILIKLDDFKKDLHEKLVTSVYQREALESCIISANNRTNSTYPPAGSYGSNHWYCG